MTQHCETWHQLEAADERAWLDQWARSEKTVGTPGSKPGFELEPVACRRPDTHNPVIAQPVLTGAHGRACHP